MGRFYKTVEVPFIDYTYKYPYQELLGALEYKQGRQDKAIEKLYTERDKLYNIDYVPGSENEQYLKQKQKAFDTFLNNASRADLSGNTGWLEAEIDKFAGDPELLDIQYNAEWWQKQQEVKQGYQEAGIWNPNIQPDLVAGARTGQRLADMYQPLYDWRSNAEQLFDNVGEYMKSPRELNILAEKSAPEFSQSGAGIQAIEQLRRLQGDQYGKIYTDKTFAEMTDVEVAREAIEPARKEREDKYTLWLAQQEAAGDKEAPPSPDAWSNLVRESINEKGEVVDKTITEDEFSSLLMGQDSEFKISDKETITVKNIAVGGGGQDAPIFNPKVLTNPSMIVFDEDKGDFVSVSKGDSRYNLAEARNQANTARKLKDFYANDPDFKTWYNYQVNGINTIDPSDSLEELTERLKVASQEIKAETGISPFNEYSLDGVHPYYKSLFGEDYQDTILDPTDMGYLEGTDDQKQILLGLERAFKRGHNLKVQPKGAKQLTRIGGVPYISVTAYLTKDEGDRLFGQAYNPKTGETKDMTRGAFDGWGDDWIDLLSTEGNPDGPITLLDNSGTFAMDMLIPVAADLRGPQTTYNVEKLPASVFGEVFPNEKAFLSQALSDNDRKVQRKLALEDLNRKRSYIFNTLRNEHASNPNIIPDYAKEIEAIQAAYEGTPYGLSQEAYSDNTYNQLSSAVNMLMDPNATATSKENSVKLLGTWISIMREYKDQIESFKGFLEEVKADGGDPNIYAPTLKEIRDLTLYKIEQVASK